MQTQYPLVFFTLLLCVSSGMLGFQGLLLAQGRGTRRFHAAMLGCEAAALVVGGIASFLHLHHWERLFNGFMHLSSGITQELIGVAALAVVIVVLFLLMRRSGEGQPVAPKWAGIVALVVAVILGFVCAHSYDMPSRPAWHGVGLFAYYYASELLLGAVCTWLVAAATKADDAVSGLLGRATCVVGAVAAVVMVACAFGFTTISYHDLGIVWHTTTPDAAAADPSAAAASVLGGSNALLFWGGAVAIGAIVPLVAAIVAGRKTSMRLPAAGLAAACALIGGVCYRVVLYVVAVGFYVYF